MKNTIILGVVTFGAVAASLSWAPAHALSCLPVDEYLNDIIGKGEVTILVGTVTDEVEEKDFTGEVLAVAEVKQGYAENTLFVYHEKSADWGYLCSAGPAEEGDTSVYIIVRDAHDKPVVTQRLDMDDPLVTTLQADLEARGITGNSTEVTTTDRMNELMATITDLFKEIAALFREYLYWKTN